MAAARRQLAKPLSLGRSATELGELAGIELHLVSGPPARCRTGSVCFGGVVHPLKEVFDSYKQCPVNGGYPPEDDASIGHVL